MQVNNSLFTELSLTEEETLSGGGFFKNVGRWFKKSWGTVAVGVGVATMAIFGGANHRSACVKTNDGTDQKICTNF